MNLLKQQMGMSAERRKAYIVQLLRDLADTIEREGEDVFIEATAYAGIMEDPFEPVTESGQRHLMPDGERSISLSLSWHKKGTAFGRDTMQQ